MAAHMTEMRIAGTTVTGATQKGGGVHGRRIGRLGLVTALLLAMLIAGALLHGHGVSQPAAPAIPGGVTNAHQLAVVPTCTGLDDSGYVPTCYTMQPNGTWLVTQKDWEGSWQRVATVTTLPAPPAGPSHP